MTVTDVQRLFDAISDLKVDIGKLQEQIKPSGTALADHEARIRLLEKGISEKAGKPTWQTIVSIVIVLTSLIGCATLVAFHG